MHPGGWPKQEESQLPALYERQVVTWPAASVPEGQQHWASPGAVGHKKLQVV